MLANIDNREVLRSRVNQITTIYNQLSQIYQANKGHDKIPLA